jgi:hypothetical protein
MFASDPTPASTAETDPQGEVMTSRVFIAALTMMALPLFAHASCDAVKSDIDAKIKANGVSHYTLDVVAADQADKSGGKVVGQCEGNKAIVYSRGPSSGTGDSSSSTPKAQHPVADRSGQTGGDRQ